MIINILVYFSLKYKKEHKLRFDDEEHVLMISPTLIIVSSAVLMVSPHCTEHPLCTHNTVSVLNTPSVLNDVSPPPPPVYSFNDITPKCTQ